MNRRKVILGLAVSLDGFIEGPNGEYDWCFTDQDYGMAEFYKRIDSLFMGRKTYELLQSMGSETGIPPMKQYVFSNTLQSVDASSTIVSGDIEAKIRAIKEEEGKDIWMFGGASLTKALMRAGLIDEMFLAVHPILLGKGKPLFQDVRERTSLKLLREQVYDSGLVILTYEFIPS